MITEEDKIRNFFKNLTVMDIANSVHLFGVDFDTCEISEIVDCVYSLFCEVKRLERIVESDFKSEDDEKVLLPSSRQTKEIVIQDYSRKCSALIKILECKEITAMLREKIVDDVLDQQERRVNN